MTRALGTIFLAAFLVAAAGAGAASANETIDIEIWNFSDMNRWVQITDLNCDNVLYQDKMEAQAKLPMSLCTDETGMGKVKFYMRVGCTKNKTVIKEEIADGATVHF